MLANFPSTNVHGLKLQSNITQMPLKIKKNCIICSRFYLAIINNKHYTGELKKNTYYIFGSDATICRQKNVFYS